MTSRQNRRRDRPAAEVPVSSQLRGDEAVDWRGQPYLVRRLSGAGSRKAYRCPGCDQEVWPGTPHLVVWPAYDPDADHRRHWHAACWRARDRRAAKEHRGRDAPRYG